MPHAPLLTDLPLDARLSELIAMAPLPAVGAGDKHRATVEALSKWLGSHEPDELSPSCQAGLWLLAGDLDKSHTLSQELTTPDGSYWHGIMHRREGDYDNAKYWFRRVGEHPVLEQLSREATSLLQSSKQHELSVPELSDPQRIESAIVDACRRGTDLKVLQQITWIEWQLLFRHCY